MGTRSRPVQEHNNVCHWVWTGSSTFFQSPQHQSQTSTPTATRSHLQPDWCQTSPKMAKKTQVHTTSWGPALSKKPKSTQSWGKVQPVQNQSGGLYWVGTSPYFSPVSFLSLDCVPASTTALNLFRLVLTLTTITYGDNRCCGWAGSGSHPR